MTSTMADQMYELAKAAVERAETDLQKTKDPDGIVEGRLGVDGWLARQNEAADTLRSKRADLREAAELVAKFARTGATTEDELLEKINKGGAASVLGWSEEHGGARVNLAGRRRSGPMETLDGLIKMTPSGDALVATLVELRHEFSKLDDAGRARMAREVDRLAGVIEESKKPRAEIGFGFTKAQQGSAHGYDALMLHSKLVAARQDFQQAQMKPGIGEEKIHELRMAVVDAEDAVKGAAVQRSTPRTAGLTTAVGCVPVTVGGVPVLTKGAGDPHVERMNAIAKLSAAESEAAQLMIVSDRLTKIADGRRRVGNCSSTEMAVAAAAKSAADVGEERYQAQLAVVHDLRRQVEGLGMRPRSSVRCERV